MTPQEVYDWALASAERYILTQNTPGQILQAQHRKHSLEINENYIKHQVEQGASFYWCSKCGILEFVNYLEPTRSQMLEDKSCFYCNHWEHLARDHEFDPSRKLIHRGNLYSDGGNKGADAIMGMVAGSGESNTPMVENGRLTTSGVVETSLGSSLIACRITASLRD